MVKLQASTEDIAAYIAHRISEDKMLGMDDDFKEHIIKEIVSASQNMFLLPALQIEAVLDEPTIRKRRKALQNMPRELYDVFGLTMDRIRAQKQSTSTVAMNVLQWIFLAARPLSLEELRHALAIEPGDTELHGDNFVEAQFILDSCLGLVIVDESTSTVRLVHKALQDYFQEMYDEGSLFQEGHMEIASICMTYMAFDHFNHEVCTLKDKIFDRYPLLGYAAVRWDYHLRSSKTRNIAVEDMAFTLVMEKYTSQLASKIFLTSRLEYSDYFFKMPEIQLRNYTKQLRYTESTTAAFPIHFAATTGSPDLFRRVIDSVKVDINEKDAWGNHLLTLTASMGHRSLVEIILDTRYNADVNAKTRDGSTALLMAAQEGHTEIVKILLEKDDVDENNIDNYRFTPLSAAVQGGHTEIVKMLLEKEDVDVNKTNFEITPLLLAAARGHTEIVKMLLEKDGVDVNKTNWSRDTPLSLAARRGHPEIVKMLLEKDGVDVNMTDDAGDTPLSSAVKGGHTEIVKMLLEKDDVDVNKTDRFRDTPLSFAVKGGHKEIVKMLLEKDDVDVNTTHKFGNTPLSIAAAEGNTEIVKMLLDEDHVDVNNTNKSGNTPLSFAVKGGHTEIVKILIDHGATVDVRDHRGKTPLSLAAQHHCLEALNILLRSSADPNLKDEMHGRTPLMWSFYDPWSRKQQKDYYNCDILKALLSHSDTNVNLKANDGSTALSRAIECELHEAEELLRAHGAV